MNFIPCVLQVNIAEYELPENLSSVLPESFNVKEMLRAGTLDHLLDIRNLPPLVAGVAALVSKSHSDARKILSQVPNDSIFSMHSSYLTGMFDLLNCDTVYGLHQVVMFICVSNINFLSSFQLFSRGRCELGS